MYSNDNRKDGSYTAAWTRRIPGSLILTFQVHLRIEARFCQISDIANANANITAVYWQIAFFTWRLAYVTFYVLYVTMYVCMYVWVCMCNCTHTHTLTYTLVPL